MMFQRLLPILLVLVVGASSWQTASSQAIERQISYQGLLTTPAGTPVDDGIYSLVVRLYDAPSGGNLVYEESHSANVIKGLFNVMIGSNESLDNVDFEVQLWLETSLEGQTPFSPRTRLAVVPYAIRAERAAIADSVTMDIGDVVRSLNGATGHLTIVGEDAVTVMLDGDTLRISASITGAPIQEIISSDSTIDVADGSGPITDLGLADGAVTEEKLAEGSVTSTKLASSSVTTSKLQDESVTASKLAPGVIPTTLPPSGPAGGDLMGAYPDPIIRPNAVTSSKILNNSVLGEDIAFETITSSRLAPSSVTNAKLADESVSSSKLTLTGATPGIYGSPQLVPRIQVDDRGRITSVSQVKIADVVFTGPASGDLTGTYPAPLIAPNAVTSTKILNGAVTGSKIAGNAVNSGHIVNGTIQLEDLQPGLIPTTLPPSGPAGGILAGTYPNPSLNLAQGTQVLNTLNASAVGTLDDRFLNTTGVTPGTYGNGTTGYVPRIQVDQYGRILSVVEQTVMAAIPTGSAGGDLSGTYPNPLVNPSASTGSRIVDAVRADYLVGDPDINTATNVVVLDGSGRLPAVSGSQLTSLSANAITSGVLPIERGGTNSSASLQNNRVMISSGGKIVESAPLAAEQLLIGMGASAPIAGTIVAGSGIDVTFTSPNFVITATNPTILSGTDPDQTLRWDATFSQWRPTSALQTSAAGNVTASGDVAIAGDASVAGGVELGSDDNTTNSMGASTGSTNSIGSHSATNYIRGTTEINTNTGSATKIGNVSAAGSSTVISVGSGGNLQLNGIVNEEAYSILTMNTNNNVRRTLASDMALEGLQYQNGAFRLGGNASTVNPLLQDRYVNLDNKTLNVTQLNGSHVMFSLDGGTGIAMVDAVTNINTVSSKLTTIGNGNARTVIGGQLDPRGPIRNEVGNVVILDQTEIIGPTYINVGVNENVTIGNQGGTQDQSVAISVGQGGNGNLYFHNIKTDPTPLMVMSLDASNRVRTKALTGLADEGLVYENGSARLGTQAPHQNPFLASRYVSLDVHRLTFNRSAGADNMLVLDANNDLVRMTSETFINDIGSHPTFIGNPLSSTSVGGTLAVTGATSLLSTLDVTGATSLLSTLEVDGATTINNTLLATSNQTGHVASIVNTNGSDGDGLLIKLGRTHGAWNGGGYLNLPNPATVIFGGALNTVREWLDGKTPTISDMWSLIPGSVLAGSLAKLTDEVIKKVNSGLNLPFPVTLPKMCVTIPALCATVLGTDFCIPGFASDREICIPGLSSPTTLFTIPAIPLINSSLPTFSVPDFRGNNVANSLTRENHYVTFQDKDGRQTGAIMAESVQDWRNEVLLDDTYITNLAASFIGIDLLGAIVSSFAEITNAVDAFNNIGVAYESGNGDYAEWLERADHGEPIVPGDVVGVRGGKISKDITDAEQVMVVSHHPIVRGNMPEAARRRDGNDVAFMGQVPVKVMGPVNSGDFIVADGTIRGYAVAVAPEDMGAEDHQRTVGRSWESYSDQGPKFVNTVIGVHNGDWVKVVRKMEQRQESTEQRLDALEQTLRSTLGIEVPRQAGVNHQ